jgi:hypothetical protein
MTDEPIRRFGADRDSTQIQPPKQEGDPTREASQNFGIVIERPSTRPEGFSEREGPTLASPNSVTVPVQTNLDERYTQAVDRIRQLEADLETVYVRLEQLTDAVNTEQLRGRAARMGRYLLWGAVIAAMATFWMLLRLRAGSH